MPPRHAVHPVQTLVTAFLGWKALLLAIAAAAGVAASYDTSGSLLSDPAIRQSQLPLVTRLTSWDALYFVQVARQGYQFEQEWAFGYGLPAIITSWKAVWSFVYDGPGLSEAVLGILVAHASHLLSVLMLYKLGILIWRDRKLAFIGACIHIFSPAGLFLSAPYAESTFSLLSFLGYYLFAQGSLSEQGSIQRDSLQLLAAVVFGVATVFRSNGILNGIPFAYEAVLVLARFFKSPDWTTLRRLVFLGVGGLCVGAGSFLPQLVAYLKFCAGPSDIVRRPWCTQLPPSIYTFVQELHWNVGLFRYWRVDNLPLFGIAAPMTFVLIKTGMDVLVESPRFSVVAESRPRPNSEGVLALVRCIAAAQVIIAILAVTSYHVQIITRLSSGYPVWCWWVAKALASPSRSTAASGIVVFIVMYASIQGALFSYFLPPA